MKKLVIALFLFCSHNAFSQTTIGRQDVESAEKIASLHFSDAKIDSMLPTVNSRAALYDRMHRYNLDNSIPLSLSFSPLLPYMSFDKKQAPQTFQKVDAVMPKNINDLAFYSVSQLASLIESRKITSTELTKFFLSRLKKFADTLQCVIELTEDIALKEAADADQEIADGQYRGMLHGIPYGLKDLFAVKGTTTTWGAEPYKNQEIGHDSYVYSKLKESGAVLIAKLTTGALAMGDYWYGGRTKNPWNMKTGSSGSSAGPASATVAGLVPFAIGTETYGSIMSPSATCGATGLRPTFGSISRYGAMALSWSLDKIGPICRSAEDAAIVFYYLHGTDELDASAVNMPFNFSSAKNISKMKIGYAKNYFTSEDSNSADNKVLETLRKAGATLVPVDFPDSAMYPFDIIGLVIGAESSAAFDGFTRTGLDDQMTRQQSGDWPNYFRASRFIPATEYINANRHRYVLMQKMNDFMEKFDVVIFPAWRGKQVAITNLTGHPAVMLPTGFNKNGLPTAITFVGNLYDEANILALAKIFQDATAWNKMQPPFFATKK